MTVPQLKEQLKTFNMPVSGKKADLVHRLETALAAAAASGHASDAASPATDAVSADRHAAEPAAVSASAGDDGMAKDGDAINHEAESTYEVMSPAGSHATASQQSMTSLEVAALSDGDEREPEGDVAREVQEEVRPGIEGLGNVATFEVASCDLQILTSKCSRFWHELVWRFCCKFLVLQCSFVPGLMESSCALVATHVSHSLAAAQFCNLCKNIIRCTNIDGTAHESLFGMVQEAAREKVAAGEGRNVEHLAEANDMTHPADSKKRKKSSSRQKQATEPIQAKKRSSKQRK